MIPVPKQRQSEDYPVADARVSERAQSAAIPSCLSHEAVEVSSATRWLP